MTAPQEHDRDVVMPEDDDTPNPENPDSTDETEDSEGGRNSKELLTREKTAQLVEGDALENIIIGLYDEIVSNVELAKNAAKQNSESYSSALKQYKAENPDEFAEWESRNAELTETLDALRQTIAEHSASLRNATEKFRNVPDVDLGNVNERHRKMKGSFFNFLNTAGVSDADSQYRVPELPTSVRVTSGWAPRLGKITVNGEEISYGGDNPTLTDLNKTLGIKGDAGSGARWAELFGSRDIPSSGLSVNRVINGKTFRVVIFQR